MYACVFAYMRVCIYMCIYYSDNYYDTLRFENKCEVCESLSPASHSTSQLSQRLKTTYKASTSKVLRRLSLSMSELPGWVAGTGDGGSSPDVGPSRKGRDSPGCAPATPC